MARLEFIYPPIGVEEAPDALREWDVIARIWLGKKKV